MITKRIIFFLFSVIFLAACDESAKEKQHKAVHCKPIAVLPVKYARGFSVQYFEGFKVVSVRSLNDSLQILAQYVILPKGKKAPVDFQDAILIDTPVSKVVCISTNHIAGLEALGLLSAICAASNPDFIYSGAAQQKIKAGEIQSIGNNELNYEKLSAIHPDYVFTSGNWDGGDKMKMKLDALHIKSVLNLDYMEQDPLARAEWIKFMAAFFDKEYKADSLFRVIENEYNTLKSKVSNIKQRSTVFCNLPFKDVWYMPCGNNYMTRLISDAGGDFLWKDDNATNGLNLSLDYEAVYNKAANADFWINPGTAKSLADIEATDIKNKEFSAFRRAAIYNNNARLSSAGGFDFWESGAVYPNLVLADLLAIFHPEILPHHKFRYYRKLL